MPQNFPYRAAARRVKQLLVLACVLPLSGFALAQESPVPVTDHGRPIRELFG